MGCADHAASWSPFTLHGFAIFISVFFDEIGRFRPSCLDMDFVFDSGVGGEASALCTAAEEVL